MQILKVRLMNIQSLKGRWEIDFTKNPLSQAGIFAITGDTGSGKTTILDAITLSLYGKTHRNNEIHEVMSFGTGECYAEIEYQNAGKQLFSKWGQRKSRLSPTGKPQTPQREIALWDDTKQEYEILATKIKDVDQLVQFHTGLDYVRFCKSVLLAQGDFAAFLNADAKDRKDLLERITGTEIYSDISRAAHVRARIAKEALHQIQARIDQQGLLSDEDIKELNAKKKAKESEVLALQKSLDTDRSLVAKFKSLQEENSRLNQLEKRKTEASLDLKKVLPKEKILKGYHKAKPLLPLWNQWKGMEESIQKLEGEKKTLLSKFEETQSQLKSQKKKVLENEDALRKGKTAKKSIELKIDQAIKLDAQIENLKEKIKESKSLKKKII